MSLEELMAVVPPPPKAPNLGGLRKWNSIERNMGIRFPADYRDFLMRYGPGEFRGFNRAAIRIPFPFDNDLSKLQKTLHSIAVELRSSEGKGNWSLPFWPEKSGLLIWFDDGGGWSGYWVAKGPPSKWRLLFMSSDWVAKREFSLSLTTFLAKLFTGQLECDVWAPGSFVAGSIIWRQHKVPAPKP